MNVKLLHRQGMRYARSVSIRHIARTTGLSRTTVRRVLSQTAPKRYGPRLLRPSRLDPFVAALESLLGERPSATAAWFYRDLCAKGFADSYELVKISVRKRRAPIKAKQRARVRFETGPTPRSPALQKTVTREDQAHARSVVSTTGAPPLDRLDRAAKLASKLRTYTTKSQLLVIDEVGCLSLTRIEANYLFQVVAQRYEKSSLIPELLTYPRKF